MSGWACPDPDCGRWNMTDEVWCWTCGTDRPVSYQDPPPAAETIEPSADYL